MVSSLFADNWAESVIVDCPHVVPSQQPVSEVLDWFNRPASAGAIAPPRCVLVIDDSELRGIVTATDILRSLAAGRSLDGMAIAEVMTTPVICIQRDQLTEPAIALNLLQQHGIHYLVVVDANASVVGVISSDHLNQTLWQRLQQFTSLSPAASSAPAAPAAPALTSQQWQQKELPLLYRITQDISQAPDLNTALVATLRHICEDTGWVYGEVWMPSPEGNSLHCDTANYCAEPQFLAFRQASRNLQFLPNQGLPGRVWTTQQAEWLQDTSQEDVEHFLRVRAAQQCGLKAGFGVPILSHQQSHQQTNQPAHQQTNQQVVAVLDFFSADARQPDPALLTLMNSVAAQLGQMIERKLWEEALIRSEATHRALISALPDLVVRMSGDGIYLDAASNPSFHTYCGDRDLIGKRAHEALPADVADLRIEHIQQALATGTVQVYEQQFLDEGDLRIEEVRIVVCGDNEVLVIARDITERKQTEA
ncbi:MAG TPA: CBS domain-containing protein, partial [Chroococcidiopsis sp.]